MGCAITKCENLTFHVLCDAHDDEFAKSPEGQRFSVGGDTAEARSIRRTAQRDFVTRLNAEIRGPDRGSPTPPAEGAPAEKRGGSSGFFDSGYQRCARCRLVDHPGNLEDVAGELVHSDRGRCSRWAGVGLGKLEQLEPVEPPPVPK